MPKEKIDVALKDAKEAGIQNILALRGGTMKLIFLTFRSSKRSRRVD